MKLYSKNNDGKNFTVSWYFDIGIIFWLTSILVSNVKESELKNSFWSEAVKKKADWSDLQILHFRSCPK